MANYRMGHFPDVHYSASSPRFAKDLQHLQDHLEPNSIVWGGDQHRSGPEEDEIRSFWEQVRNIGGGPALDKSYSIPGNHDEPYVFVNNIAKEYIGDQAGTPQLLRPVDGLSIMLINTQGPAIVRGGEDPVALDYGYVPYREVKWLYQEVQAARERSDVTIIVGHTPVWFSTNPNIQAYHIDAPWNDPDNAYIASPLEISDSQEKTRQNNQTYEVVLNYHYIRQLLATNSPVVYICGHDFHGPDSSSSSAEEYRNIDGIYHTWKDHYAWAGGTFAYVDVDTSSGQVKYITVDSSGNEQTIMDISPPW